MNSNMLLWLLISLNVGLLVWGLFDSRRIYRFTLLASGTFMGFAIPQLVGLSNNSGVLFLPDQIYADGGLDLLILFSCLCLLGYWLGDNRGVSHPGKAPIHT